MKKIALLSLLLSSSLANSQSITNWTQENGTLGLGYPVPIPVDTPEPFDGFRTYSGLLSKHQEIENNNPYVKGHIVGKSIYNRDIWAYVFSDVNDKTKYGVKEGAILMNGNIHAREWQSPEVVTGVMELLNSQSKDQSIHQYLLENTSIVILPVNNPDGLLQTQRYPTESWYSNQIGPRDGRMRRKNMRDTDEIMTTQEDHLFGVDLNRNSNPYWASSNRSSFDPESIVYHGAAAHSEPETLARLNAAALFAKEQYRVYTDVHSFSRVHFSISSINSNRNAIQQKMLLDFSNHHVKLDGFKWYQDVPAGPTGGIGATDEYFGRLYEIPSWTLEIEPGNGAATEYGGFNNDGHSGFILPESEIRRVRTNLADSFMVAWYKMAGPPSIAQFKIREKQRGIIVYDAEWDVNPDGVTRTMIENKVLHLTPGVDYELLIRFDKPMRIRDANGNITALAGQPQAGFNPVITGLVNEQSKELNLANPRWINKKSDGFESYGFYKDDTFVVDFDTKDLSRDDVIQWSVDVGDLVQQKLDSNPATVTTFTNGEWQNYEDSTNSVSIVGGADSSYKSEVLIPPVASPQAVFPPKVQNSALYYDPTRNGEGFSYELLNNDGTGKGDIWLQWFTYDDEGNQRWYFNTGKYEGNVIRIQNLKASSGGVFGPDFDSSKVEFSDIGSLEIIFSQGLIKIPQGNHNLTRTAESKFTDLQGNKLRTNLHQLSFLKGNGSDLSFFEFRSQPPILEVGDSSYSGSWYDPKRDGEGYIIEILEDERALLVWYTYTETGKNMWLLDSAGVKEATDTGVKLSFNNVMRTQGPMFGDKFDANDLVTTPWGTLTFDLKCKSGTVSFTANDSKFGSGSYELTKLTSPLNRFICEE